MINFAHPWWLLLAIPAVLLVMLVRSAGYLRLNHLPVSDAATTRWQRLRNRLTACFDLRVLVRKLPRLFLALAVIMVAIACAAPQVASSITLMGKVNGRDIMFALDNSGSMGAPFKGEMPKVVHQRPFFEEVQKPKAEGEAQPPRRLDAGQAVILQFVERRMERKVPDSVGLIVFSDRPRLVWPLDRDLKQISRHGNFVPGGRDGKGLGGGTNFGAKPPGPIDLAVEHLVQKGTSKTRVFVLVTDGEDKLAPEVQARLEKIIKAANVRFYVVGIGDKLQGADILEVAKNVGGTSFVVNTAKDLEDCFASIDKLESSQVPANFKTTYEQLFYVPLAIGLVFAFLWAYTEAVLSGR